MAKSDPLILPRRQLAQAREALHQLRGASASGITFAWYDAWEAFVNHLEKAYARTYVAVKEHSSASRAWKRRYEELRTSDPLLRYLREARNVEEHHGPTLRIGAPQNVRIERSPDDPKYLVFGPVLATNAVGHTIVNPLEKTVVRWDPPAGYALKPITQKRGSAAPIEPPTSHLGDELSDTGPIAVAKKGLAFYEGLVHEAAEFISETPQK